MLYIVTKNHTDTIIIISVFPPKKFKIKMYRFNIRNVNNYLNHCRINNNNKKRVTKNF